MTDRILTDPHAAAHVHGRSAARWLQVAGYHPDHGYWRVGAMHAAWHILVDPKAAAGECLWAARSLLETLEHDVAVERRKVTGDRSKTDRRIEWDSHDAVWHTTLLGAALETARNHLLEVDRSLVGLKGEPQPPAPERYRLISSFGHPNGRLIKAI